MSGLIPPIRSLFPRQTPSDLRDLAAKAMAKAPDEAFRQFQRLLEQVGNVESLHRLSDGNNPVLVAVAHLQQFVNSAHDGKALTPASFGEQLLHVTQLEEHVRETLGKSGTESEQVAALRETLKQSAHTFRFVVPRKD